MGYRALLKNYIRHLLRITGDHYIEAGAEDGALSKRDLAELRLLAAEAEREDEGRDRRTPDEPERGSSVRPEPVDGNLGSAGAS